MVIQARLLHIRHGADVTGTGVMEWANIQVGIFVPVCSALPFRYSVRILPVSEVHQISMWSLHSNHWCEQTFQRKI